MALSSIYMFCALGALLFLLSLAVAAAIWLFVPGWLVANFSRNVDKAQLETEDVYRRTLAQILGFPLAAVGVVAAALGVLQALATYGQSQELEYQKQYSSGFEALASDSMARRIGGLYLLQGLTNNSQLAARSDRRDRNHILMTALAAFAIDKSSPATPAAGANAIAVASATAGTDATAGKCEPAVMNSGIVKSDVLIAMQIIGYRKLKDPNVYNLRSGNFAGSILADMPAHQAYFENSDLDMSNFTGSGLYVANFTQASLRFTHFDGANLAGALFTKAGISGATFCANFNSAVPEMVHDYPVRTQLTGSHLDSTYGEKPLFNDAWMVGADLKNAQLVDAKFNGAVLDIASFESAHLDKPDFSNASLQGTTFKGAVLKAPVFTGARIRNVDFTGTGVTSLILQAATLCNVTDTEGNIQPSKCGVDSDWTPSNKILRATN